MIIFEYVAHIKTSSNCTKTETGGDGFNPLWGRLAGGANFHWWKFANVCIWYPEVCFVFHVLTSCSFCRYGHLRDTDHKHHHKKSPFASDVHVSLTHPVKKKNKSVTMNTAVVLSFYEQHQSLVYLHLAASHICQPPRCHLSVCVPFGWIWRLLWHRAGRVLFHQLTGLLHNQLVAMRICSSHAGIQAVIFLCAFQNKLQLWCEYAPQIPVSKSTPSSPCATVGSCSGNMNRRWGPSAASTGFLKPL